MSLSRAKENTDINISRSAKALLEAMQETDKALAELNKTAERIKNKDK